MKNKKLFNLSAIILGAIMLFNVSKVNATESAFGNTGLTRSDVKAYVPPAFSSSTNLGISKDRESGNSYTWNPNTVGEAKTVWKIAEVDSSNIRDYSNLYYCLNAERGFGLTNGEMAEGAVDEYTNNFDMKEPANKSNIINYAGGNLGTNYNKILWILDNSYIPTDKDNFQESEEYRNLMTKAGINLDSDSRLNLTEDEIEVVQQMAIWHFTNSENSNYNKKNLPSLYLNGQQLSSKYLYTTNYGQQITGKERQDKAEKLYKYFIENASSTYKISEPILSIQGEVVITESGNNYIVGPYTLAGENTDKIKEILVTSQTHNYTLLDSSKNVVTNNDFTKVLGKTFYLQIPRSEINETTDVELEMKYTYDVKNLTFITNPSDPTNTQPVVLVETKEEEKDLEIDVIIPLENISVEKIWNDKNNQDGIRPNSIKVQLYKDGNKYGDSITLSGSTLTHTWTKLLAGSKYTVKELNSSNNVVENNEAYNKNYMATYHINGNTTKIINTYIPLTPDLALRKYITSINGEVIIATNNNYRVPQINTDNLDDENQSTTTARYVHKKDPIQVKTGNKVVYNITIYNEGEKDARASKITDQLPSGLKYTRVLTQGYTADYNQNTNRLVITKEGTNNLTAYTKNGTLSSETIQVECEVTAQSTENNKILTNIAWISEMKDANNNTFDTDIDSNVNDINTQYNKDNMSNYEGKVNDVGYYKGQQDDDDFDRLILLAEGVLNIQLQKVDKNGTIITSAETTFKINDNSETTSQGKVDFNSQKLTGSNFEFTYTIEETQAPVGYNGLQEPLTVKISGTTKVDNKNYVVDEISIKDSNGNDLDINKISAQYDENTNTVIIKVVNTKIENGYSVKLLKVGEDGTTAIENSWFKVNNGQAIKINKEGNEIATGTLNNEQDLDLTYILEETIAPEGYIKIEGQKEVKITAKVELKDGNYQLKDVNLKEALEGITVSEENNVIIIKVENKPEITGQFNIILRKVDAEGNKLEGSKFKVSGKEYDLPTGEITIYENEQITSEDPIERTYVIEETVVPVGYNGIENTEINIKAQVQRVDNNYRLVRATLVDSEGNNITDEDISIKLEGESIVIEVKNTLIEKKFDLSLRKFITQINDQTYSRKPVVDTSKLGTVVEGKTITTATYKHTKQPIVVQKGDVVTYTIRVYNEGEVDGYVEIITDHLPDNLLPILSTVDGIDTEKYAEEIKFNEDRLWQQIDNPKNIFTTITSKSNSDFYSEYTGLTEITDTKLNAYVEGSNELDYIDVQIKCLVTDSAVDGEYLTNIAEISKMCDADGVEVETDIDSTKANADYSNLGDYKNEEAISSDTNSYIPGQEDDDDFEKLWVKEFDLSLRKFITKVNETSYSRAPVVDTSKLETVIDGKTITTATYNHSKEPVIVETGDLITYEIRIYNEGSLAGFANEITDAIPQGLEFLPDSSVNVSYRWEMLDTEGNKTEDVSKAVMIVTDYLSDIDRNNIINAVSEQDGVKKLSYKDVEVQFKVTAKAEQLKDNLIINEAQISNDSDRDVDSATNRNEKYDYTTGKNEDDIDYEPIKLQYFDLALRKFVTKVNTIDYNNRYPEVIYNEDGTIKYNHTKDPVLVTTGDTIVYTIRVYNEGEKAGTATEITDNLPEGLEFLPDNETNKTYGWKLIDEAGAETQDLSKAVKVTTNILENETIEGIIIKEGQKILSYKDIKIAFKVTEKETSNKILVNTAEISKDSADDVDSIPDNKVETEDDLDKEYVKVKYFDLALKKWVTATKVTYNGKTTTTKTGFTEDSEGIAKVDLVASKMKKTTVKFTYNIKVINEGELPGYAYEVKDYIPNGLKFVQEDNKDWKELKDGVVVTDKLKDTLLNPGESAIVEITLTWKNSTTNLALKTNYAEVSQDSGNDIDSTPDNFNKKEDDIDDAQVILSIKTAGATTYVGLILTSVSILAVGIFLIKKYVIR